MPLGLYSIQTQTQYIPEDYDSDNKYRFECMSTVTLSWLEKLRNPFPKFAIYARVSLSFQCWITSSKVVDLWKTMFCRYGVNKVNKAIEYKILSSCKSYLTIVLVNISNSKTRCPPHQFIMTTENDIFPLQCDTSQYRPVFTNQMVIFENV